MAQGLFVFGSIYMCSHFPRKWLLTTGHGLVSITLLLLALTVLLDFETISTFLLIMLIIIIQLFIAGTYWIYIPEVCNDV